MSLRVLMIIFGNYPYDTRVRKEAEALVDAGMAVDVLCTKRKGEFKKDFCDGVRIYRINLIQKRSSLFRYLLEYLYFIIVAFIKVTRLHLAHRYHAVHVHNIPDVLVLGALVPKLMKAKIILDMHEIMPEFFMQKYRFTEKNKIIGLLKTVEKFSIRFSDRVVVATPFLAEVVQDRSLPGGQCTVIQNLPDPKFFQVPSKEVHHTHDPFRLVYPGTISRHHGVDLVIRAMQKVRDEAGIRTELYIYGYGSEMGYLKSLVKQCHLQGAVFFHDEMCFERIVSVLSEMDAGVVPKRDGVFVGEAMSTKLFDFAAAGISAIVSRTPGDSLYFDDSMVMFFEPDNINHLAECIITLSREPKLRESFSRNAYALYQKFNWSHEKKNLCLMYRELLK